VITGDGADQVFCGTSGADYLPLVGSLGRAAGVFTIAPFLHAAVQQVSLDPGKRALRSLALELGVPPDIALCPKRGRFAPPMDLARHRDGALADALARSLGREPTYATDRERVGFATLALFARSFPGLEL
jgi:asparagine synthase (glutamine-hydrolysing)